MEQINLVSDSDEMNDESVIIIPDSETDYASRPTAVIIMDDEEGELSDDVNNLAVNATENNKEESAPIFQITFKEHTDFEALSFLIVETLQNALQNNLKKYEFEMNTKEATINAFCYNIPEENINSILTKNEELVDDHNMDCNADDDIDYSEDFKALFSIDTEPSKELEKDKVPSYKRVVKEILAEEPTSNKKKNDPDSCTRIRPTAACFNCGAGNHAIRDCPKPRNIQRINRSKKAFISKNQERYHIDIEQRYAHFRPGVISDKLQAALGLRRGELPFFFYRMRTLGYPPGWLEDAKVAHSGMTLFNSEGNEVLESDDDEGEVDVMKHKYDASKIREFPGFNKDPGSNFFDDYKHHNVPPFNPQHLKKEFIKSLGVDNITKGYKRRKMKNLPGENINQQNNVTTNEITDMDLEDPNATAVTDVVFTRPLPPTEPPPSFQEEKPPLPPPPPQSQSSNTDTESAPTLSNERSISPTLADLEAEQKKLLLELQASTSVIIENDDSLIDEVIDLERSEDSSINESTNIQNENKIEEAIAEESTTPKTPKDFTQTDDDATKPNDIIKDTHLGTPLLKFSPFDKLPAGDNFKVGVSDVINFENLPDSTGKYEQMKVVIKKVRNIITKLNNEDD